MDGLSNSSLDAVLTSGEAWTENFGDGIKDLDKTFHAWLDVEKKDLLIFGRPYSEFLTALETSFSSDQNRSSAITPTLKFKIGPTSRVKGEVKFIDVAPDYFKKEQGADKAMFLGCEDLACLNSSGVTYSISLNTITFRSAPIVSNESGISTSTTKEFSIAVQGLPAN